MNKYIYIYTHAFQQIFHVICRYVMLFPAAVSRQWYVSTGVIVSETNRIKYESTTKSPLLI